MTTVHDEIDVHAPVDVAYAQWTRVEEFPAFMEGVLEVRRGAHGELHWTAEIGGIEQAWTARIVELVPDRLMRWESTAGSHQGGTVTFEPLGEQRTRIALQIDFEPVARAGDLIDALQRAERRVHGDLERCRDLIEGRCAPHTPRRRRGQTTGADRADSNPAGRRDRGPG